MMIRTYRTALALLLLVAPLGASLCGDCASGHCETIESLDAAVVPEGTDEPRVNSHCHEAEAEVVSEATSQDEPAPCHDEAATTALSACCALAAAPTPDQPITPTPSSSVVTLEAAIDAARLAVVPHRSDLRRRPPVRPLSEPLYTLHGAFLI